MKTAVLILAGGVGKNFWPQTDENNPKHTIRLLDNESMIEVVFRNISSYFNKKDIYISTNRRQKVLIKTQLTDLQDENIIAEPFYRNTAAGITFATFYINRVGEYDSVIIVPVDHIILDYPKFIDSINQTLSFIEFNSTIVAIGLKPKFPDTKFGYFQIDEEKNSCGNIFRSISFSEKPNSDTAERFLYSGDFLWNTGILIYKIENYFEQTLKYLPDFYNTLSKLFELWGTYEFYNSLSSYYGKLKSVSIDKGILEKSNNLYVLKSEIDWMDIADWNRLENIISKDENNNFISGNFILKDSTESLLVSESGVIAVFGISNIIVIKRGDKILISSKEYASKVNEIYDYEVLRGFKT